MKMVGIRRWGWPLIAGAALFAASALAADKEKSSDASAEKRGGVQEEMSEVFHDTWKGIGQEKDAQNLAQASLATASADLREQPDSYVLRLNLPGRDLEKVKIDLSGGTLHIVAPVEEKVGRYEQSIRLEDVASTPRIERDAKSHLIVVTVPKNAKVAKNPPPVEEPMSIWDAWDQEVLQHMSRMQQEMDRIFLRAFPEGRSGSGLPALYDRARFGSSYDLQNEKENYVVRVYLPDRDMDSIHVTVEGQTLKLEAKGEERHQNDATGTILSRKAQYSQVLSLPGPVHEDKMKVERKENVLVVTLPKASAG